MIVDDNKLLAVNNESFSHNSLSVIINNNNFLVENGENIQVLRYEVTQKYEPHFDYFYDEKDQLRGGHRYATILMYLSDVEEGGETVFPKAEVQKYIIPELLALH